MASGQNKMSPRKFSEKIALLNKKEAEGNAQFEEIIKEVRASKASGSSSSDTNSTSNGKAKRMPLADTTLHRNSSEEIEGIYQSILECVEQYDLHREARSTSINVRDAPKQLKQVVIVPSNNDDNNNNNTLSDSQLVSRDLDCDRSASAGVAYLPTAYQASIISPASHSNYVTQASGSSPIAPFQQAPDTQQQPDNNACRHPSRTPQDCFNDRYISNESNLLMQQNTAMIKPEPQVIRNRVTSFGSANCERPIDSIQINPFMHASGIQFNHQTRQICQSSRDCYWTGPADNNETVMCKQGSEMVTSRATTYLRPMKIRQKFCSDPTLNMQFISSGGKIIESAINDQSSGLIECDDIVSSRRPMQLSPPSGMSRDNFPQNSSDQIISKEQMMANMTGSSHLPNIKICTATGDQQVRDCQETAILEAATDNVAVPNMLCDRASNIGIHMASMIDMDESSPEASDFQPQSLQQVDKWQQPDVVFAQQQHQLTNRQMQYTGSAGQFQLGPSRSNHDLASYHQHATMFSASSNPIRTDYLSTGNYGLTTSSFSAGVLYEANTGGLSGLPLSEQSRDNILRSHSYNHIDYLTNAVMQLDQ